MRAPGYDELAYWDKFPPFWVVSDTRDVFTVVLLYGIICSFFVYRMTHWKMLWVGC